jgi:hypothetical protein
MTHLLTDTNGVPYAQLSKTKPGDILRADAGFTCMNEGDLFEVLSADDGLYIPCRCGRHYLDGQLKDDSLIGLYIAQRS